MGAAPSTEHVIEAIRKNDKGLDSHIELRSLPRHLFEPLAGALQVNVTLVMLDIDDVGLRDEGAQRVGAALIDNRTLKKLYIGHNMIGPAGAEFISVGLQKNTGLTFLNMSSNPLGPDGIKSLVTGLCANKTLQTLEVFRTGMSKDGATALSELLGSGRNKTITSLHYDKGEHAHVDEEIGKFLRRNASSSILGQDFEMMPNPNGTKALGPGPQPGPRLFRDTLYIKLQELADHESPGSPPMREYPDDPGFQSPPESLDALKELVMLFLDRLMTEHRKLTAEQRKEGFLDWHQNLLSADVEDAKTMAAGGHQPASEMDLVAIAGQLLWCSTNKLPVPDLPLDDPDLLPEFCSLLNQALRMDGSIVLMRYTFAIVSVITEKLRISNRFAMEADLAKKNTTGVLHFDRFYPDDGYCYRGTGMPQTAVDFFITLLEQSKTHARAAGRAEEYAVASPPKFRVPMFFTTTLDKSGERISFFANRSLESNAIPALPRKVPVYFRVSLNKRGLHEPDFRCRQVARLLYADVGVHQEIEFMFAPYSVFTITAVTDITKNEPPTPLPADMKKKLVNLAERKAGTPVWFIDMTAALNSAQEPIDLPLCSYA
eukprot:m.34461 g.34461  ORF g.34461 m.34461 type:complete len:601 (+) comp9530_c0_seq1:1941-3743(+)